MAVNPKLRRRELLLAGIGMLAAGCSSTGSRVSYRPGPAWPDMRRSVPSGRGRVPAEPTTRIPDRLPDQTPVARGPIRAIPRSNWARGGEIPSRLNPMGYIDRLTVHHEGWTPVWFDDPASTAARLEQIRKSHLQRMAAGDIGYHFVIDRAGRLWEGRSLQYQGAHVRDHNPHNIGVMCLGNFDLQRPTDAQQAALQQVLLTLCGYYRIPVERVFTHRELNPTECPGNNLQARMVSLRQNNLTA